MSIFCYFRSIKISFCNNFIYPEALLESNTTGTVHKLLSLATIHVDVRVEKYVNRKSKPALKRSRPPRLEFIQQFIIFLEDSRYTQQI
jgi:hypothetical protein